MLKFKSSEAALAAYAAGQRFQFQASASNTGAVTARINTLAAVAVKKAGSAGLVDLVAGDIRAGALYDLNYDGTYFQLGGGVGAGKAFERFSFEASVGQTTFNVPHTIGSTIVLRNGREVTDYQADGQKIIFRTACAFGDSVEILAFSAFQSADSYTKAEVQALMLTASALPVGTMLPFPRDAVPAGFLEVDGRAYSAAIYPDLAAYLGGAFDKGDEGAGFFRLPDTRGEFLRGWDHGLGVDVGRGIGTNQTDSLQNVTGSVGRMVPANDSSRDATGPFQVGDALNAVAAGSGSPLRFMTFDLSRSARTSTETRPRNLAVMWCIKAWNAPVNQGNIDVAALAAQVAVGIPKYYLHGLGLSVNAVSPTTAIDVAPGIARGAGNPVELNSAITGVLQAVGNWTPGAGGNKLDTGVRTANSWYNVFMIQQITDGQADLLFSLSASAPMLPAGYGVVRRIASIATNEANEIIPFINVGRRFLFQSPIKDGAGSMAGGDSTRTLTLSVPRGKRVLVHLHVGFTGSASTVYLRPTDANVASIKWVTANNAAALAAWGVGQSLNTSDVDFGAFSFDVVSDASGAVEMQLNNASAGFYSISTLGYSELD
ncbi:tail fiber protein [Pseudomonas xanthosomatis]|nr:tail fiber protein [Pseudomonas xanthosomatis]